MAIVEVPNEVVALVSILDCAPAQCKFAKSNS